MTRRLPDGRAGQLSAAAITLALMALLWSAAAAPILEWQTARLDRLGSQTALAARMAAIAGTIPLLEQEAALVPAADDAAPRPLDGATDALAGAALQEKLDDLAVDAGLRIASAEALPAEPGGTGYRAIRLRISVSAPWAAIITLLHDAAAGRTPLVVDDLQLHGPPRTADPAPIVDAAFTVTALRRVEAGG